MKKLEEFIKENKGKKYRLNPLDLFKSQKDPHSKIIRSASTQLPANQFISQKLRLKNSTSFNEELHSVQHNEGGPAETEEDDGFFCSELVAAAYQAMGMLPGDRPASSYWPSTLAREDLNNGMLDGTRLSRLVYLERK